MLALTMLLAAAIFFPGADNAPVFASWPSCLTAAFCALAGQLPYPRVRRVPPTSL